MRSPLAPTASISLASGTPSNLAGSLYQGVLVENEVTPSASSIARSNCAVASLFVALILPLTVRIGLSVGSPREAAPARLAVASTNMPNNNAAIDRVTDRVFMYFSPNIGLSRQIVSHPA